MRMGFSELCNRSRSAPSTRGRTLLRVYVRRLLTDARNRVVLEGLHDQVVTPVGVSPTVDLRGGGGGPIGSESVDEGRLIIKWSVPPFLGGECG